MTSLRTFRQMAGLPDTIRRWKDAAEHVKAGQKALRQNPSGEDAADNPHHGTSNVAAPAAPVDNRRDSRRDGSGAEPARDGSAPRPTHAEKPMDVSKWPVSNVTLEHPVGLPSDLALLGRCDMPEDTPVAGPGLALSMVKFQIYDAVGDVKLAEEVGGFGDGVVRCVFGSKDLPELWNRLSRDGSERLIYILAWPRFYVLKDDGSAELFGDDRGYHAGAKVRSPVYRLSLSRDSELLIDGKAEPKRTDPGPTAEEQAEIDRSDRQMREEREAHERQEREIKERAARENRENDAKMERELRERDAEQARLKERLDAQRQRGDEEMDAEKRRAAAERARLGIPEPGDVSKKLNDPPFEDRLCLAMINMWESQYAPDNTDGFKERLKDLRRNMDFKDAVDQICKRMSWTL